MTNDMVVETTLVARTYAYRMFQMFFGDEPSNEMFAAVFSESAIEALEFFAQFDSDAYRVALGKFKECATAYKADGDAYLEQAKLDYMHLLIGPGELACAPWECVYVTNERVLFQESTLKVREAYRKENMLPTQYPHVSDDHIAIELDFLAKLSAKAQSAFDEGSAAEYARLLESQRAFLADHVLVWVGRYAADLAHAAADSLYARTAALCASFASIDAEVIGELLEVCKEG